MGNDVVRGRMTYSGIDNLDCVQNWMESRGGGG